MTSSFHVPKRTVPVLVAWVENDLSRRGRATKVRHFLLAFKEKRNFSLIRSEARAYLEMNVYDVEKVVETDSEWGIFHVTFDCLRGPFFFLVCVLCVKRCCGFLDDIST